MDWELAIERQHEALKRMLAMLVAMAGLGNGQSAIGSRQSESAHADDGPTDCLLPTVGCRILLPRRLHRAVLRLLRPVEAAVRRLMIVAARGIVVTLPPARPRAQGDHTNKPASVRTFGFQLFDPLPRYGRVPRPAPRGMPRISVPGFGTPVPVPVRRAPAPDDPLDARRLALRLAALARVLDDLPRAARRLARWRARASAGRSRRAWPLRPGRPPGHRPLGARRTAHEAHEVLDTVHELAVWALEPRDTS